MRVGTTYVMYRIGFNEDRIAVAVCVLASFPHRSIKTLSRFIESGHIPSSSLSYRPRRTCRTGPNYRPRPSRGRINYTLLSSCLVVIRGKSGLIVAFEKPATGSQGRLTVCGRGSRDTRTSCYTGLFFGWKNRDGINSVTLIFSTMVY